ncbi:MAG: LamG domain-containing protein, partial [Kiritimatiellae bacterium]|nr:LamG domain-containing protein [Kiritimatiellia bacterium]
MKRFSMILFAAAFAAFGVQAADSLTMADFGHSIKLQVNGYTGSETLQNFPVLVRISESGIPGFRYSDLSNSKGLDIAFFDAAGNHLASEIQTNSWKATDNESQAWVLLPEMTQGTKFYMCYNTSASGVWVTNANPWTEYVGVWHLDEKGGTSKPVYDSTTNALNGITSAKGSPAVYAEGKVGKARRIATDTSNNPGYDSGITVDLTDAAKRTAVDTLAPQFTASFWYRPEAASANYEYLLGRKNADSYSAWALQFGKNEASTWSQIRVYGANGGSFANSATTGDADTEGVYIPAGGQGQWHKMDCVWTFDKKYHLYADGVLVAEGALSGNKNAANGNLNLSIGGALAPASGKGGRGFNGEMDEVRVRVGTRSADWIKADYDTVNNASFVIVAPPDILMIAWANASGATPGVSGTTYNSATFGGTVQSLGEAASCDIEYK